MRNGVVTAAKWIGIPLVVLAALGIAATAATAVWADHELDELVEMPPVTYPPDAIACEGLAVDAACVARAAAGAQRTIAWLPDVGGRRDRRLVVAPQREGDTSPVRAGGILYETVVEGVDINLTSAPAPSSPGFSRRAGLVRAGDVTAEAWRSDDGSSMRLDWRRADQEFRLEALALPGGEVDDVAGVVQKALAAVAYAPAPSV